MRRVYRILYLILLFGGAVVFFAAKLKESGAQSTLKTVKMGAASFPTISVITCGEKINCLYGYNADPESFLMRESLIPVSKDAVFELDINEYENTIRRLKYELYDIAGGAELDSGTINAFEKQGTHKVVRIRLKADLKEDTEYAIRFTLINNTGKKTYYFSRIKQSASPMLSEKLAFIKTFSDNTRSSSAAKREAVIPYLEMEQGAPEDSYGMVDIHSNFRLVAWNGLAPELVTEPIITVTEFYKEIMSVSMRYTVALDTGYGEEELFVEENFRIRYLSDVVHLLNYERHAETVFDVERASLSQNDLKLGVCAGDPPALYRSSDDSSVAFVRNDSLYEFNLKDNSVSVVFSAESDTLKRIPGQQGHARITVLKIEQNGNLTFLVSGYMNRGVYEGRIGLFLYRYYQNEKYLEELLYIPRNTTEPLLHAEAFTYAYMNDYDGFFFLIDGDFYSYNIITKQLVVLAEDIVRSEQTTTGESGYLAYQTASQSDSVTIFFPESGTSISIPAREGEFIRLLAKADGNIVCGYGRVEDMAHDAAGIERMPMYRVEIINGAGEVLKEYEREGCYVTGASASGNVICLSRVRKRETGGYESMEEDYVLSKETVVSEKINVARRVTEKMLGEYYISFPSGFVMEELPKLQTVPYAVATGDNTLRVNEAETAKELYAVYAYGKIDAIFEEAGEAIVLADERAGTVLNADGRVVWERGIWSSSASAVTVEGVRASEDTSPLLAALSMMLRSKGVSNAIPATDLHQPICEILTKHSGVPAILLTGVTPEETYYFLSKGMPLLLITEDGQVRVVTGYTTRGLMCYDPGKGKNETLAMDEAREMLSDNRGVLIGYLY